MQEPKLELATKLGAMTPVNVRSQSLEEVVNRETEGWGADVVFEASGAEVAMLASGAIDVDPLITDPFAFTDSIEAFDFAKAMPPTSVKVQIKMPT